MKPAIKISHVVLEKAKGDVFTLHVHNIGKTSESLNKSWELCEADHIDAVESESGAFYRPLDEDIEELMEEFEESRQEVKDGTLSYLLEEALSNETYLIHYDQVGADGKVKELNVKLPQSFEWGKDSAEDLNSRSIRIFEENYSK